jgi:hypothetical protein
MPCLYAGHIVPHDTQARELGTGKSRLEVLESLGLRPIRVAPIRRVEDGINAVRMMLPKCWFDPARCARGIDALKLYRAEVDERRPDPSGRPLLKAAPHHDWTSHAADAFRQLALTLEASAVRSGFHRGLEYPRLNIV